MGSSGVGLAAYRLAIGLFEALVASPVHPLRRRGRRASGTSCGRHRASIGFMLFTLLFFVLRAGRLTAHGDVERNPGPSPASSSPAESSAIVRGHGGWTSNSNQSATVTSVLNPLAIR